MNTVKSISPKHRAESFGHRLKSVPTLGRKTRVVNCRKERYDVKIMRGTKWGNPFHIGRDGTRKQVIAKYRVWVQKQPHLMNSLGELYGKILGCCCKPLACHGDVLVELAEEHHARNTRQEEKEET